MLVAAPGRGDDDAVAPERRLRNGPLAEVQSSTATGRLIGVEPVGELDVGHVGPAQVELGLAAVVRAVADQDDPERLPAVADLLGQERRAGGRDRRRPPPRSRRSGSSSAAAFSAAACHWSAHWRNWASYSGVPGAPTTMSTHGRSVGRRRSSTHRQRVIASSV